MPTPAPKRQRSAYVAYRALGLVTDGTAATGCAPCVYRRGTATFIVTPVDSGQAVHLYDVNLHLRGVSHPIPNTWISDIEEDASGTAGRITCLAAFGDLTFVALGGSGAVGILRSMRPNALWKAHRKPITHLSTMANFLISVSSSEHRLLVWRLPTKKKALVPAGGDVVADIEIPEDFSITTIVHPPTYVNKVLLGGLDGRLMLVNVRTGKIVYEFESFGSKVCAIEPAPILDVVAVSLASGKIVLHNIRADETLFSLHHGDTMKRAMDARNEKPETGSGDADGQGSAKHHLKDAAQRAVYVASFSTDGSETLVTGDGNGDLCVWDLKDRAILAVARAVHVGGMSIARFLAGESLLVTAGVSDNCLKIHVFDGPTPEARVLRSREGHRLPPTRVRFTGRDGKVLVSAGLDRELRVVSAVRDAQNRPFSQAGFDKASKRAKKRRRQQVGAEHGAQLHAADGGTRLPAVTGIASCIARRRDKDFASVVTIHARRQEAYTWRLQSGAAHKHILRPPPAPVAVVLSFDRSRSGNGSKSSPSDIVPIVAARHPNARLEATSTAISHCGNFAFVGHSDGVVHAYNLQSGRHQGVFALDPAERQAALKPPGRLSAWPRAHDGPVTGLAVDACGDHLVSGSQSEEAIRFWNMRTRELSGHVITPAGPNLMVWSKSSDLVGVACNDLGLYVYDARTKNLARRLLGHRGPISDIAFDGNGRRVVTASMDSTIRTWDLPSGTCVDVLVCRAAPTSVAVAPEGDYIASTHVNSLSIALWADSSRFGAAGGDIGHNRAPGAPAEMSVSGSEDGSDEESDALPLPTASTALENAEADTGAPRSGEEHKLAAQPHDAEDESVAGPPSILGPNLITLSGRQTTEWTTLANLKAIRQRNKPIEAPKKPADVPFFLPTVQGLEPSFEVTAAEISASDEDDSAKKKRTRDSTALEGDFFADSDFGKLVGKGEFETAHGLLMRCGPAKADVELRTVERSSSRNAALRYFTKQLESRRDFEMTQAHLDVFLKAHGREIAKEEDGAELLQQVLLAQSEATAQLTEAVEYTSTLAAHFAGQV